MVNEEPEVCLHPLVVVLQLPVHSRVVCGRNVLCDPQYVAYFSCELRRELGIPITDDFARESEVFEHVGNKDSCGFLRRDGLIAWNEQCRFSAIVVGDG